MILVNRGVSIRVEGSGARVIRSRSRSEAHALCVMTGGLAGILVDKFGRWLILVNGSVSIRVKGSKATKDFVESCESHSGYQMEGCRRVSSRVQAVYSGSRVYEQVWESLSI